MIIQPVKQKPRDFGNIGERKELPMSDLIRWEPVRETMTLREAMDHLFDDAFTRPFGSRNGTPAIDLYQTDDSVVVKAALPGIKPDEVQLSVSGDVLTLKGEFHKDNEVKEATY